MRVAMETYISHPDDDSGDESVKSNHCQLMWSGMIKQRNFSDLHFKLCPTEAMARDDNFNRAEVGKRVNFGLAYGSQGHALVKTGKWKDENDVERSFTWDMLSEGLARWKARFTGVGEFIDNTPDLSNTIL